MVVLALGSESNGQQPRLLVKGLLVVQVKHGIVACEARLLAVTLDQCVTQVEETDGLVILQTTLAFNSVYSHEQQRGLRQRHDSLKHLPQG